MFFLSCKTLHNYSWAMCTLFSWQGVDNQKVEKHLNCRWKPLGYVHMEFFCSHMDYDADSVSESTSYCFQWKSVLEFLRHRFFSKADLKSTSWKKVTCHVLTQIQCENSIGHPGHELALLNGSNPWPNS